MSCIVVAQCLPPVTDNTASEWFRPEEVAGLCAAFVGKPVYVEFDKSKQVGRVQSVSQGEDKRLYCQLEITDKSAIDRVRSGELKDVGIGVSGVKNREGDREGPLSADTISLIRESCFEEGCPITLVLKSGKAYRRDRVAGKWIDVTSRDALTNSGATTKNEPGGA